MIKKYKTNIMFMYSDIKRKLKNNFSFHVYLNLVLFYRFSVFFSNLYPVALAFICIPF
jgi:hypothetical protein